MKRMLFTIFAMLITCTLKLCAVDLQEEENIFESILLNAPSSIDKTTDEKIFLKPEKVFLFQGKICVEGEYGEAIPIPHIYSNETGLYLNTSETVKPRPMWICTSCSTYHSYEPERCRVCNGTEFYKRYQ